MDLILAILCGIFLTGTIVEHSWDNKDRAIGLFIASLICGFCAYQITIGYFGFTETRNSFYANVLPIMRNGDKTELKFNKIMKVTEVHKHTNMSIKSDEITIYVEYNEGESK